MDFYYKPIHVYIYIMMESTVVFVWWILGFPIHGIFSSLIVDSSFTGSLWDMTMPCVCHFFSVWSAHLMVQTDIKLYRYNWLKKHHLSNPQQNLCLVLFHHSFKPPAGTQWPLFEGASQKLLSLINLYARSVEPEKGEWLRRFKI